MKKCQIRRALSRNDWVSASANGRAESATGGKLISRANIGATHHNTIRGAAIRSAPGLKYRTAALAPITTPVALRNGPRK